MVISRKSGSFLKLWRVFVSGMDMGLGVWLRLLTVLRSWRGIRVRRSSEGGDRGYCEDETMVLCCWDWKTW